MHFLKLYLKYKVMVRGELSLTHSREMANIFKQVKIFERKTYCIHKTNLLHEIVGSS